MRWSVPSDLTRSAKRRYPSVITTIIIPMCTTHHVVCQDATPTRLGSVGAGVVVEEGVDVRKGAALQSGLPEGGEAAAELC